MRKTMPGAGVEPALPIGEGNFKGGDHARHRAPTAATVHALALTRAEARRDTVEAAPESAPAPLAPLTPLGDAGRVSELARYWRRRADECGRLAATATHAADGAYLAECAATYRATAAILATVDEAARTGRHAWQRATLSALEGLRVETVDEVVAFAHRQLADAYAAENNARAAAHLWRQLSEGAALLDRLATEALAEDRAGRTEPLTDAAFAAALTATPCGDPQPARIGGSAT